MRNLPIPPVDMTVIPFGFDGTRFNYVTRDAARKRLGISQNQVIGLCFGRFSEYDKMDLFPLLQAFQRIYKNGCPWRLILAGAAHHPEYVKMVALWIKALGLQKAVDLKTDISEQDKVDLFKSADFFISPSDNLQETFGLTLVEALAAGLPLIVSDFSGYREIATSDVAKMIPTRWKNLSLFSSMPFGPLADEAALHRYMAQSVWVDIDAMASAMLDLFTHPEIRSKMSLQATKRFKAHFDYALIIEKIEKYWLKLKKRFSKDAIAQHGSSLFPNYFQSFSHYFTESVSNDTLVKSTDFAKTLMKSGQNYPLLPGMEQAVDQKNVQKILELAEKPTAIEKIVQNSEYVKNKTDYQIMWMLKHGLLETC